MRRLSRILGECAEAALAEDQPVRLHDWRILAAVHDEPGITVTRAGPLVLLNKMQASRSVNRLIDLGLVRASVSATDGRAAPLELTALGAKVFRVASQRMAALEIWALDPLTLSEIGMLEGLLHKVESRLSRSASPDASALETVYRDASERRRAAYLFDSQGDRKDASKP